MIGAILGDIIGSTYEFACMKNYNFKLLPDGSNYTDDSVLTIAIANAILSGTGYGESLKAWALNYPNPKGSYGGGFLHWIRSTDSQPYNSFGNGSAMRVSSVGWLFDVEEEVLCRAKQSAECTHNHPEGIKGAQATAIAVYFARKGKNKQFIQNYIEEHFGYNLHRSVEVIRRNYFFDETCQGTVPEAITCFLNSDSYEDAVRKAVSLGGDSDTIGAITGGIAEAFHGVPKRLQTKALSYLPEEMSNVIKSFNNRVSHD